MRLHRQLLEWEWFDNSQMVHIWVYFLLKANYQDNKWHGIDIPRGSFITSLDTICKDTGLSLQSVRTCMNKLKSTGEITIKSTNKYSVITICKYETYNFEYSDANKQNNKQPNIQLTNNQQSNNKQLTTDKESKEGNKENKRENIDANASTSAKPDAASDFDYKSFVGFFNSTLDKYNSIIPRIRAFDDKRKSAIHARLEQCGEDALYEVVEKSAKSLFLNGGGSKGWKATFDWIFGPVNFKKVLEGNYDNDKKMGMEVGINYQGTNTGKYDNMELW